MDENGTIRGLLQRVGVSRARARGWLEGAGVPLLLGALWICRLYRPDFHHRSRWLYLVAERVGVYPLIDHYHEPLIRLRNLDFAQLAETRQLPGIDLRIDAQLRRLDSFKFGSELLLLEASEAEPMAPTYDNLAFGPGDAEVLYSMIRHVHPRLVIEVGSGHSTRFAHAAIRRNSEEGSPGRIVCIEPYESEWVEKLGVEVIRTAVEELDLSLFRRLRSGDVLFIDSSHVLRPQGDVLFLVHNVLPLLPPGVFIHVHDMFTPRDYPLEWLKRRWLWNEQYLVEALLADSRRYEVYLALNHLFVDYREAMDRACPVLARRDAKPPTSFWIRIRTDAPSIGRSA